MLFFCKNLSAEIPLSIQYRRFTTTRHILSINSNWYFSKEATAVPEALCPDWEAVNVPHCWNAVDGQDGGYSTWRVDLAEAVEDENLLVIAVDNAANDRVYPQMADFTFYGGLYRNVNIIAVSESHFDLDYYGTPGIKVTPVMEGTDAKTEVEVFLTNAKEGQFIRYTLLNKEGKVLGTKDTADKKVIFRIKNAHLWHGRKDPCLYSVKAELVEGEEVLDTVMGTANVSFTKEELLKINDQLNKIRKPKAKK